jgi:zinc protease
MVKSGKKFFCLLVIVLITGCYLSAAPAADQVLGQRYVLPNGLIWLFSQQTELPLVTVNLTIKAGALFDPPQKEGLANLTASLLRFGTQTRTAQQIAESMDFLGASFSTGADRDIASIKLTILKKDLPEALKIFQDVLLNPRFASQELRPMVQRLQGTLKSQEDEPGIVASRAFRRAIYGDYPYGFPEIGTAASLLRITSYDLFKFHRQYYHPNNAILTIVGDLTQAEAQHLVEEFFGDWKPAELPPPPPSPSPRLSKPTVIKIDKDITQANIILGEIGIKRSDPDFYAFQIMNYILGGGGFSSRLMDNIRENRGLVYNVHSSYEPGLEPGPFDISLETKNASGGLAVTESLKELDRIRSDLVSEKELTDAKSYLISSFPMKMDSSAKRAALMGYVELYGLGLDYPWHYPEILNKITRDDVLNVARKYLDPDHYALVVVGKQKDIQLNLPGQWQEQTINPSQGELVR